MNRTKPGVAKTCMILGAAAVVCSLELAGAQPTTPAANRKMFTDSVTELPPAGAGGAWTDGAGGRARAHD